MVVKQGISKQGLHVPDSLNASFVNMFIYCVIFSSAKKKIQNKYPCKTEDFVSMLPCEIWPKW